MKEFFNKYLEKDHSFDKKTMIGIISLIIVIGGVFGFIYEYIFYYFNFGMKYFYWKGGNFLPWINIYAIGAVMIYFLTYKHRKNPFKVFLISVVSTGILEYFSGLFIYLLCDGLRYWNYNTEILNFGNISGFICFRSVAFFGISALLLMYVIVPLCFYLATKTNKQKFLFISTTICLIVLMDATYNLVITDMFNLPKASVFYKKLGIHYLEH